MALSNTLTASGSSPTGRRRRSSRPETSLACLAVVLLLLACAERRVWEWSVTDPAGALFKSEQSGKVVSLLVEGDSVELPSAPGIDIAHERQRLALRPGVPPHVAICRPAPRAPPIS